MNNTEVDAILDDCARELDNIKALLVGLGDAANPTPYVKKYAVIRATGSIEVSFKQLIADKVDEGSHSQIKNFIRRKIRDSSANPSLGVIESLLVEFDQRWKDKFDELLALADKPVLKGSLTELVRARNAFAHGGAPETGIETTIECFGNARKVLTILDEVLNIAYDE